MWRFTDARSYTDLPGWDGVTHVITLKNGHETRKVRVWVTGSAQSCDPGSLPPHVAEALRTGGRSVLRGELARAQPPRHVVVSKTAIKHHRPVAGA